MKKQIPPAENRPEGDIAEFEGAANGLEKHLDRFGVTEKHLLDAAAKVRERMPTEVYGLEAEELVQP